MMRRLLHRGFCRISLLLSLLSTAACGIAETNRIDPELAFADPTAGCASALGSYALPKAHLHIIVSQTGAAPPAIKPAIDSGPNVEVLRHIDPALVFCLDYLASPLAHDTITIKKWPVPQPTGTPAGTPVQTTAFLGSVSVNALDRTAYVLEALIRAAFIAASGQPDFGTKSGQLPMVIQADLEYDPFDPDESAAVNQRLTKLGFCLVLEGYTFQRRGPGVSAYCNAPRAYPWRHTLITKAYVKAEATPADKHLPGLLYRPRVPYRLEIYQRVDVGSHDPWQLIQTMYVNLENLSPVLALDIHRAAFAGRNANFVFDAGALKVACVSKTSEVEGFVNIPLQISKSIVALPGSILSVQIDQIGSQTQLVQAEQSLYQVQQAYLAALKTGNYQTVSNVGNTATSYSVPDLPGIPTTGAGALPVEPKPLDYGTDLFSQNLATLCGVSQ
jgi:hypothetical protein